VRTFPDGSLKRLLPSCAALLTALAVPAAAGAWRQGTAVNDEGVTLSLSRQGDCVVWSLSEEGTPDVPDSSALRGAVRSAFETWNAVDCTFMRFVEGGASACGCDDIGYDENGRNANLVAWCEESWPADFPPEAIAITVVSYNQETGQIYDTDVAFNGTSFTFTAAGSGMETDVRNTMTHEAGHMIGIGESDVSEATMWPYSGPGDVEKRTLSDDDRAAVCAMYPVAADPGECIRPYGGLATCKGGCGCVIGPDEGESAGLFYGVILAAVLAIALMTARKRRRRL